MNLALTADEVRFRDEVRAWLDWNVEPTPEFDSFDEEFAWGRRWQARLAEDRWVGIHWPVEYGGRGRHRSRWPSSTWSTPAPGPPSRSTGPG